MIPSTTRRLTWWLPIVAFVIGLAITALVTRWHEAQNQEHINQQLNFELRDLKEALAIDIQAYQQALGVIRSTVSVARDIDHQNFTPLLSVRRKSEHPGAIDFGLAKVTPQGFIVESLEKDGRGNNIIGKNLAESPVLNSAARLSAQSNKPMLSDTIEDIGNTGGPGFVMFLPIFRQGVAPAKTSEESLNGVFGWVFARLSIEDIFIETTPNLVEFELYDVVEGKEPSLIYASTKFSINNVIQNPGLQIREARSNMGGRNWLIRILPTNIFWKRLALVSPWLTFTLGLLGSLMVTAMLYLLTSAGNRAQQLAERMTAALRTSTNSLRVSEDRLQDYSKSASDWFWETDAEMRFLFISASAEKSLGRSPSTLIGIRLDEIACADDLKHHEKWNQYFEQLKHHEAFRDFEVLVLLPSKKEIWSAVSGVPHFDENGQFSGYRGSGSNITIRKQTEIHLVEAMEAAQHASRMKSEFLANMSHEIRTPMNGVLGMITLLQQTQLDPEQQEFATTVQHSAQSLLNIINDILDFSKVEAGRLDLELIDFDPRAMAEEINDILAYRAAEKGLEFGAMVEHGVPNRLHGDPGRLRQIILNLAGNAIKFTESGLVDINISMTAESEKDVSLRIEVTDTGIGIEPDQQQNLFNPFVQADGSITRKYGGTGLGLSISKRLVELMGGEIGIISEMGQGATFWFTVRLQHAKADNTMPQVLPALAGRRILVVDDHVTNRRLMELLLEDMDCTVVMADSGPQALQLLDAEFAENRSFDIIVTDLQMPEMDGEELGKLIKADPRTNAIPLVMLTSVAMRGDGARLAENNFAAYLTKPIKSSLLYQCLQTVLGITRNGDDITPLVTRHTLSEQRRVGHILVVEDNLTNQRVAQKMLERLGHTCELANNGLEGLKKLEAGDFDLVLMDCQMPEMDGYQATQAIRAGDTKVRNPQIPIIALTANAMQGDRDAALEAGMSDYLPKPFDVHLFEETLARWLKKIKVSHRDITILATFSPAEVLNRMDDDLEMAILIIREGVIELERMLPLLEIELANGDMTAAFRVAHTIKGMADSVGGVAMHDTSAKVCNAIKKDDLTQAATFIPKLHAQLSSLKEAANAWLEEQKNNNA